MAYIYLVILVVTHNNIITIKCFKLIISILCFITNIMIYSQRSIVIPTEKIRHTLYYCIYQFSACDCSHN